MDSSQQKAWIVFAEAFGTASMQAVRPSSLTPTQLRTAESVLNDLIAAYAAARRSASLSGLLKFKRPGVLQLGGVAADAARWPEHRARTLSEGALPFQLAEFHEWMERPCFIRGLALRKNLALAFGDEGLGGDLYPTGFDLRLAKRKVDADIQSQTLLKQLLLGLSGL